MSVTLLDIVLAFLPSSHSDSMPLEVLTHFQSVVIMYSYSDLFPGFYTLFNLHAPLDFQILR